MHNSSMLYTNIRFAPRRSACKLVIIAVVRFVTVTITWYFPRAGNHMNTYHADQNYNTMYINCVLQQFNMILLLEGCIYIKIYLYQL